MSKYKGVFIHYINGARGDFLASILSSGLTFDFGTAHRLNYIKAHALTDYWTSPIDGTSWEDKIANLKNMGYYTIRIVPKNVDALIQISYLNWVKKWLPNIPRNQYDLEWLTVGTLESVIDDRACHSLYDDVIDFDMLSDVEFLKTFYKKIHHIDMSTDSEARIRENIKQQPNVFLDDTVIDVVQLLKKRTDIIL